MKISFAILALVGGEVASAKWEKCDFPKMARVFFKDEKCKEIDWTLTKEMDKKFGPISKTTEGCSYNEKWEKSFKSACTADSVTFWGFEDKKCDGKGKKVWTGWFNKCVKKMVLFNKAKPWPKELEEGSLEETIEVQKKEAKKYDLVPCQFHQMDRVFYKDESCTEIDYEQTKKIDDYYYPINYATETCGCSAATGKCHTSVCSADYVKFWAYDIQDNKCQGKGEVNWYAPFNKCVNKMILHNKAAPGYKAPNMTKESEPQEQVSCNFKQQARVFYKDDSCTEIDFEFTKAQDEKYYPISYATESCGCNSATGKCHTATCTENALTFKAYDFEDKQCKGEGNDFWKAWFNKCVGKMIVHNRAAPGFNDPGHGLVPGGYPMFQRIQRLVDGLDGSPKSQRIQRFIDGFESAFTGVSEKAVKKLSEVFEDEDDYDFLN